MIYRHSNTSVSSTSSAQRFSTNNPFRSALLQEEATVARDAQYGQWVDRRIDEESVSDSNSFSEGDEGTGFKPPRPRLSSHNSDSTVIRKSANPFTEMASRENSVHGSRAASAHTSISPTSDTYAASDLPPPSYAEATGRKYGKDEYPEDVKKPVSESESDSDSSKNPFPASPPPPPRRSNTMRVSSRSSSRRNISNGAAPPKPKNLDKKDLTSTTETEILADGRVRSKSAGQASLPRRGSKMQPPDPNHHQHHHHHHHHHHRDSEGRDRHRSRKKFVMQKPKNLDTIDKLDVTGFYGGAKFHHDGPFDACTPHRNKDTKQAPVLAFPPDGPNSTLRGVGPLHSKEDQYDMVFGLSEEDPLYTTKVSSTRNGGQVLSPDRRPTPGKKGAPQYYTGNIPYGNGLVVQKVGASTLRLDDAIANDPSVTRYDVTTKATPVHGDTTLGLGSSTFMDGAPASKKTVKIAVEKQQRSELTRKKSILETSGFLKRVKSLKVRKTPRA